MFSLTMSFTCLLVLAEETKRRKFSCGRGWKTETERESESFLDDFFRMTPMTPEKKTINATCWHKTALPENVPGAHNQASGCICANLMTASGTTFLSHELQLTSMTAYQHHGSLTHQIAGCQLAQAGSRTSLWSLPGNLYLIIQLHASLLPFLLSR